MPLWYTFRKNVWKHLFLNKKVFGNIIEECHGRQRNDTSRGGAGKKFGQIKDVPDSFVAADGMETGVGNKIPLWLFGFLY